VSPDGQTMSDGTWASEQPTVEQPTVEQQQQQPGPGGSSGAAVLLQGSFSARRMRGATAAEPTAVAVSLDCGPERKRSRQLLELPVKPMPVRAAGDDRMGGA
jgi:hypothetical protein